MTPNNVTLDAYGIADLTSEPMVCSYPPWTERHRYTVQIGDRFDEVTCNLGGLKGPRPGTYL